MMNAVFSSNPTVHVMKSTYSWTIVIIGTVSENYYAKVNQELDQTRQNGKRMVS